MMISDGCGFEHIRAADYYQSGAAGTQRYESFGSTMAMSTYSISGSYDATEAWSDFGYMQNGLTDSAAAATAMSTGHKTYIGGLGIAGTSAEDAVRVKHIAERAEELGKSTGVVTTVAWSDATPAGFVVHQPDRHAPEPIAREMVNDSRTDVIMGAGNPFYDDDGHATSDPDYEWVGGAATWDSLVAGKAGGDADGDGRADPWRLLQSRTEFQRLAGGKTPKRVLGTFRAAGTAQQGRGGDAMAAPYEVPLDEGVPTLAEMSRGALNVLDDDSDGFFLMVEGGAVDRAGHANEAGRMIEEELDFDSAVNAVIDWVGRNSDWDHTTLIVTADHETGYVTGPDSGPPATWNPIVDNGRGVMPGLQWHSTGHSNALVPLFVKGFAAEALESRATRLDPVRGRYLDNTDVGQVLFQVMR